MYLCMYAYCVLLSLVCLSCNLCFFLFIVGVSLHSSFLSPQHPISRDILSLEDLVFNRKSALACAAHRGLSDYWSSCSIIVGFSPCSISTLTRLLCCCGAIKNALGLLIKARTISYSSILQVTLTDWHHRACWVGTPAATPQLQFCIMSAKCPDVLGHFDNIWPTQLKVPKVAVIVWKCVWIWDIFMELHPRNVV